MRETNTEATKRHVETNVLLPRNLVLFLADLAGDSAEFWNLISRLLVKLEAIFFWTIAHHEFAYVREQKLCLQVVCGCRSSFWAITKKGVGFGG